MSERKKLVARICANIILSIILTIALQAISNTIVAHTKCGLIVSSAVFGVMFVFIIGDIINAIDKSEIEYCNRYHSAVWKWEVCLLLNAFIINVIAEKILTQQYSHILTWGILLVIAIIIARHFWRKLIAVG